MVVRLDSGSSIDLILQEANELLFVEETARPLSKTTTSVESLHTEDQARSPVLGHVLGPTNSAQESS